jgi:hypothetical protein
MSEQNNGTDINSLSIESIKAYLYDQIIILERTKNNIQILQARLKELQTTKGIGE